MAAGVESVLDGGVETGVDLAWIWRGIGVDFLSGVTTASRATGEKITPNSCQGEKCSRQIHARGSLRIRVRRQDFTPMDVAAAKQVRLTRVGGWHAPDIFVHKSTRPTMCSLAALLAHLLPLRQLRQHMLHFAEFHVTLRCAVNLAC